MAKRSDTHEDANQAAFRAVQEATERGEKNPAAVALGRLGGRKGGRARAENLTPEQLSEIGKKGAAARWKKYREEKGLPHKED